MKKLSKCLITGGAGFIGSHLCDRLITKGCNVVVLDNLITGRKKNIEHLLPGPRFKFFKFDVTNPLTDEILESLSGLQYIYHLASPASPPYYKKYSIETLLVNSLGTKRMLDLAKLTNAKFLFSSTSEVYGNPLVHPQKEDYFGNVNPIGVRACYDEAKRFGEALIMEYIRKFSLDARIVRIFNTYGPRMQADDGRVVVNFVNQALHHNPLVMYGDGLITRSFCFVTDMVNGLELAMDSIKTKGEVINLGYPKEHTVKEIAQIIKNLTGSTSIIRRGKQQEDDPVRRRPDITKAKKLLQWEPKINLITGLTQTIDFFRSA